MSQLTLTGLRLRNARWEGRISSAAGRPEIRVTHLSEPLEGVVVTPAPDAGQWDIAVPIPARAIADGVQTFLVWDAADDSKLGDFALIAGEALAGDLRAEIDLLRAELDMLKRAFRRHCLESS